MPDSPLEELERLAQSAFEAACADSYESTDQTQQSLHDRTERCKDALFEHADWLLSRVRGAEKDREDAERYRFIRDDLRDDSLFEYITDRQCTTTIGAFIKSGPDLDAAVDAARKKGG